MRKKETTIQLIRHATVAVQFHEKHILVDPMLSRKGAMDPVVNAGNNTRIPMTELPLDEEALSNLLQQIHAVLVTHTHRDHWDERAVQLIPKNKPIFCQPEDEEKIKGQGFTAVQALTDVIQWENITINRTIGKHGTGEIGKKMGPVSGFVLTSENTPVIYIAGDTIWCKEVETALQIHQPQIILVNAGAAQFLTGEPITMTADDIAQVCRTSQQMKVIAVHMDTVNHCLLTRQQLREFIKQTTFQDQVLIPSDGEVISV